MPSLNPANLNLELDFSVKEYLTFLNTSFKQTPQVSITGELGVVKFHSTGTYFNLKDKDNTANLECFINPFQSKLLSFPLEEGMMVKVLGQPTIFSRKGTFKFVVSTLQPVGEGSLKKVYEYLKKKLNEEGLFDRKRPLPKSLTQIAVITSSQGAVIHDFQKNLKPMALKVDIFDCAVEGLKAENDIVSALRRIQTEADKYDLCVIIRGGGSAEDLAVFNSEKVARAVFALPMPSLVGIGHETDTPLINYVADKFASTPTATAQEINKIFSDQLDDLSKTVSAISSAFETRLLHVEDYVSYHYQSMSSYILKLKRQLSIYRQSILSFLEISHSRLNKYRFQTGVNINQLQVKFSQQLAGTSHSINNLKEFISSRDPSLLLEKGWYKILDSSNKPINDLTQILPEQEIQIQYLQGKILAKVLKNLKHEKK